MRLELTWPNKDKFLLVPKGEDGKPVWVERDHPAASEVRLTDFTDACGDVNGANPHADNLLFTGDSLDALRVLAEVPEYAREYRGKVKLIYIDPPFNTGQTFEHYDDWMEHSTWLSFMRDRLLLMKDLLSNDGSIWVHLDDVEIHRMRAVMDEVFGAGAFVAQIAWRATDSSSNNAKGFAKDHNVILVYGAQAGWRPYHLLDPEKSRHYRNPNSDPRGPWYDGRDVQNPKVRPNLMYDVVAPNGNVIKHPKNGWRWERATFDEKMASGELFFNADQTAVKRIAYLWDQAGLPPSDIWFSNQKTGSSRQAKNHLKALFPDMLTPDLFDTPKPERLMQFIIDSATRPGDIVLDCFAGSGATAATAHKMGRRWVTSELSPTNIETFALPRLQRVVTNDDPGGITSTTERVAAEGVILPDDVTPQDAKEFNTVLGKVLDTMSDPEKPGAPITVDVAAELAKVVRAAAKSGTTSLDADETKSLLSLIRKFASSAATDVDVTASVKRQLKSATKTEDAVTVNWHGGGGFRQVRIAPSMYEPTPFGVLLAEWATNGRFARAVSGQLGFEWKPDGIFCGQQGRMRLAVFDGAVGPEEVRQVASELGDRESVTIVAQAVLPGTEEALREASKGSRIRKAPRDLLSAGAQRTRRRLAAAERAVQVTVEEGVEP
ncbi:site-specific DNA-methyltransferase [Nocardioides rotundus]|uniref:site-specific DNA-methyltransferase n=1 Tax=Nocardioides rotundus TaxID=1774216 RepID=UPI001CBE12F1|nr:site-specific DNA-methyltransferase [Nocardioides rotundus]UAL29533.1 site-specific DNA-methyltransferase [Nocardioides rotundus]